MGIKKAVMCLTLVIVLAIVSCESLDNYVRDNQETIDQATGAALVIGTAAAPATGGVSLLLANLAAIILPTLFAVNRTVVAYKRKRIIEEIDGNSSTPAAREQVVTTAALASIDKVLR